jgi:hypothetical protein
MRNSIKIFKELIYFIGAMLYFFIVSIPATLLLCLVALIIYLINQIKSVCKKISMR